MSGLSLLTGTMDGSRRWKSAATFGPFRPSGAIVGALPWATGPVDGLIATGHFDGAMSHVAVVSTGDGQPRTVLESGDIVHSGVIDATSGSLVILRLSSTTRQPIGIDVVDLGAGQRRLLTDAGTLAAVRAQVTIRLFATNDGHLLVLDCRDDRRCTATALEIASGRQMAQFETVGGDPIGLLDGHLVVTGGCELPCALTSYDLSSGADREIGTTCGRGQIAMLRGQEVLVSDQPLGGDCFTDAYAIRAYDRAGDPVSGLIQLADDGRELVSFDETSGAQLPDGWVILGPHGRIPDWSETDMGPILIELESGRRVALAAIPGS
jgi:hypothetical protein